MKELYKGILIIYSIQLVLTVHAITQR